MPSRPIYYGGRQWPRQANDKWDPPDEPRIQCPSCQGFRSIRWFSQSTYEAVSLVTPVTKVTKLYGKPIGVCPYCHKGQRRGPRAGQPGNVFVFNEEDLPEVYED